MFTIRVYADVERSQGISMLLAGLEGVRHVAAEGTTFEGEQILTAEVSSASADDALDLLVRAGVAPGSIALMHVDAATPLQIGSAGHWVGGDGDIPPWSEVVGEARAQARLVGRYLTLMVMAGIIAGVGVADRNIILVIGAMAISPDLLPMVATCIAIAGQQPRLARRAIITLAAGLGAAELAVLATATVLKLAGHLKSDLGDAGLGGLTHTDLTTVIIALAAGVAGVLAFQAKAGSAVGVAISVTTIPAVAYLGVAAVTDHGGDTLGAVGVLITNVLCVIVAGTATIATQDRIRRRHRPGS